MNKEEQDKKEKKKKKRFKKIAAGIGIGAAAAGSIVAYKNKDNIKKIIDKLKDKDINDDKDKKVNFIDKLKDNDNTDKDKRENSDNKLKYKDINDIAEDKMKNFINKLKDPIKNKQIEPKSSEPLLFDDFCFESFNNYNMIADELQYRIDVNDLTFEEADLINDIAYNRYVIEVSQEEQLKRAGVPEDSQLMRRYKGTAADIQDFEDRDISELPNKKALKKPERIKRDMKKAEYLYGVGPDSQLDRLGIDEGNVIRYRGQTEYRRGEGSISGGSYDKDTPSMKKAESLLSNHGSTSRQPITADSTRKKNLVAGVLTRKLGGFDKDATYWIGDHGNYRNIYKRNSPPGFEPGSVKSKEELEKEGEKGRYTLPEGYILLHVRSENGLSEIKPGNTSGTYRKTDSGAPAQIHGRGRIYCTIQKKDQMIDKDRWGRGGHGYMITSPISKLHFDWEDKDNPHSKVNITDPRKLIGRSVYIETDKPLKCKQLF